MTTDLKVSASIRTIQNARAFLMEPASEVEEALIASMQADIKAAGFEPPEGFIEWDCVEHDVIHWLTAEGQQWIELDPKTGIIMTV